VTTPTWYDLLGVDRSADADRIRAAWRDAIADLDPTERRFATLNEAAAVLLDPARRRAYDAELAPEEPEAPEAEHPEAEHPEVEPVGTEDELSPSSTSDSIGESTPGTPYLVPGWVLGCVAVVAAAAVILAAVLATRPSAEKTVQADVQLSTGSKVSRIEEPALAAEAAAKTAVVPVLSYDYRHLDDDKAAADKVMTDGYRKKYDKLFEDVVRKPATTTQTVITTKVVGSAIVRAGSERVQVLLDALHRAPQPHVGGHDEVAQGLGEGELAVDLRVEGARARPLR
jgi:Mce-associated membrane protein